MLVLAAHVWLLERNLTDFPTPGMVSTLEFETGRVFFHHGYVAVKLHFLMNYVWKILIYKALRVRQQTSKLNLQILLKAPDRKMIQMNQLLATEKARWLSSNMEKCSFYSTTDLLRKSALTVFVLVGNMLINLNVMAFCPPLLCILSPSLPQLLVHVNAWHIFCPYVRYILRQFYSHCVKTSVRLCKRQKGGVKAQHFLLL